MYGNSVFPWPISHFCYSADVPHPAVQTRLLHSSRSSILSSLASTLSRPHPPPLSPPCVTFSLLPEADVDEALKRLASAIPKESRDEVHKTGGSLASLVQVKKYCTPINDTDMRVVLITSMFDNVCTVA